VTAPAIYKNLGYDPSRDFVPVATLFSVPHMLVVHPSLPIDSMERLVSYAKANPGKVSYASPGFGTQPHLLAELFRLTTGANIVHVPYKGATPAVTDILAGQVQMYLTRSRCSFPTFRRGNCERLP
jgi:tripartite-type tricarboxylate transporter receptor subunit TctC